METLKHDLEGRSLNKYLPLRVWPAWLVVVAMLIVRVLPQFVPEPADELLMVAMLGPPAGGILLLIWWLGLSRARWQERIVGVVGIVLALAAVLGLVHYSMRGVGTIFLTFPMGLAAFGIGTILFRRMLSFKRTVLAILLAAIGFGYSTLLRNEGMWSNSKMALSYRWSPSPEDRLVANRQAQPNPVGRISTEVAEALLTPAWPSFRGADRTGRQRGSLISRTWSATPQLLWKIPTGPSWSSFAVAGDLLFTQEQRGEFESVITYDANTGKELWVHEVNTRFEEAIGGPGPRATPTLANLTSIDGTMIPALFALGANGTLMRLNPTTGAQVWQLELQELAGRTPPTWGFSSSPLVVGSNVIVHAGGEKGIFGFDVETGELVWSAPSGDHSYSSPQLNEILGQESVLMLTNNGLEIFDPANGQVRLNYEWKYAGYRSLQPYVFNGDSIVLPTQSGTRLIRVSETAEAGLTATEIWTSRNLKPDFNDFVVFEEHIYGFDGSIFTCVEMKTGDRVWKGGRYGKGQVLLLADSGLLLVAAESGKVVILSASPEGSVELGSFPAIDGKSWSHPVVVGDRLFIRNAQEAACFRLPIDGEIETSSNILAK